jgi:hypothetical protein
MAGYDRVVETLFSYSQQATASVPTASPGSTMCNGWPAITVPAGQLSKLGEQTSSLRLVIEGGLTATATIPSFAFLLYMSQANPAAFATTNQLHAISGTNTPGGAVTAARFRAEWNIKLRALGAPGANSTLVTTGWVKCPAFASPFEVSCPAANTATTFTTFDPMQVMYLWPAIILGAATAGNTVTPDWAKLYAES